MGVVHGDHHVAAARQFHGRRGAKRAGAPRPGEYSRTGRLLRSSAGAIEAASVRVAAQSTSPGRASPNEPASSTKRAAPGPQVRLAGVSRSLNAPDTTH